MSDDKIKRYEVLLSGLSGALRELLTPGDFDDAVDRALSVLGVSSETDRCYLFTVYNRSGHEYLKYANEWVAQGIEPQIDNPELKGVKSEEVIDTLGSLKEGHTFKAVVDEMPVDAPSRVYFELQKIKSVILVPVLLNERFFGFVGFDSCQKVRIWLKVEIDLLESFAGALAGAFQSHERRMKLKRTNQLLRMVTDSASDIIALIDTHSRFLYLSPSVKSVLGYTQEEIEKIPDDKLFADNKAQLVIDELFTMGVVDLKNQRTRTVVHKAYHKSGKEIFLETKFNLILDSLGEEKIIQIISRDISVKIKLENDQAKTRKKERELINLRSLFVSMASHQLRTPLAVIQSNLDLVLVSLKGLRLPKDRGETITSAVKRIKGQISNMVDLMEEMLMLGDFQERGLKVQPVKFSLEQLLKKVVREVSVSEFNENHEISLSGREVEIFGDEKLIKHAVVNLLENSCKYSDSGSLVEVWYGSDQKETKAFIEVKDSGVGIDEEDLKNVTSSFFRGKNIGNKKGTGLGLAIVKEFVSVHDGDLKISSKLGKGTSVKIAFPLSYEAATDKTL